jgi:hypothetical protein
MTETQLKNQVRTAVRNLYPGAFIWKIHDNFTAGIPDLLIIIQGVHIFIELKTPKGKVEPIQEWTLYKIKEAGGCTFVCRSKKEVLEVISLTLSRGSQVAQGAWPIPRRSSVRIGSPL